MLIERSCMVKRGEAPRQGSCCKARNRAADVVRSGHKVLGQGQSQPICERIGEQSISLERRIRASA